MKRYIRRMLAVLVSASMIVMGVPAAAFAAAESAENGTVDCGNGWVLAYSAEDGQAEITGVSTVGSGSLAIPSSAGSSTVTSIGEYALSASTSASCPNVSFSSTLAAALTSVSIPDTVTTLDHHAFSATTNLTSCDLGDGLTYMDSQVFFKSGLTSITLPASLEGVNYQDFMNCTSLASINFESDTFGYIGRYAFSGCTSLTKVEIPVLTSRPPASVGSQNSNYRINNGAFANCSSLESIVLLGNERDSAYKYWESPTCLNNCPDDLKIVYLCGEDSNSGEGFGLRRSSYDFYYTVYFYPTASDADAGTNLLASVIYPASTGLIDLAAGAVDTSTAYDADHAEVPMSALDSGEVWGIGAEDDDLLQDPDDTLSGTYSACPVDQANLDYGFVYSPEIDANDGATSSSWGNADESDNAYYVIPSDGGAADVSNIIVRAADGSEVESAYYGLSFQKETYDRDSREYTYEDVSAESITDAGTYVVTATGASGTVAAGSSADAHFFTRDFSLNEYDYSSESAYESAGRATYAASEQLGEDAYFSVVAPADSWQLGLVGLGLAGVGNSIVAFSDNEYASASSSSTTALDAIVEAGSLSLNGAARTSVFVLGTEDQVSTDYRNRLNEVRGTTSGLTSFDQSTPQELALTVYETIKKYGKGGTRERYEYQWGSTAIVASATRSFDTLAIGQLAYKEQAPVFYTENDGSLSSQALSDLSAGGFTKIVIAGDSSYVSDAVVSKIQAGANVTPVRMMTGSTQASTNALGLADTMRSDYGSTIGNVVLANASSSANLLAACELAAVKDGIVVPITSTVDSKYLQDYIAGIGAGNLYNVYYVGSMANADPALSERIEALCTSSPQSTDVAAGDTFESDGYLFTLASGTKATYTSRLKTGDSVDYTVRPVTLGGTAITATGYDATALALDYVQNVTISYALYASSSKNLFAGNTQFKSVKITGNNAYTLAAGYFKGCTGLTSVSLGTGLKGIGKSAFQGCTALKKVALKSTALKTIGASAFQGDTKLSSVSFASKKLTTIGKSAFQGCSKLASMTFKTTKLTKAKVGKKAFTGTAKKATVKVPKTVVKKYTKIFQARGLSKKATVKKA